MVVTIVAPDVVHIPTLPYPGIGNAADENQKLTTAKNVLRDQEAHLKQAHSP